MSFARVSTVDLGIEAGGCVGETPVAAFGGGSSAGGVDDRDIAAFRILEALGHT
jgi:hypothetical protein